MFKKIITIIAAIVFVAFIYPTTTAFAIPEIGDTIAKVEFALDDSTSTKNAALALSFANGIILRPGQIFSFNETVGPRTLEKGFVRGHYPPPNGPILQVVGSGICIASTGIYYLMVKEASLEMIERYSHSVPVGYVPPGYDAAVDGLLDLKVRNNKSYSVQMFVTIADKWFYGRLIRAR
jgi:vancomycin resistance protein YoaR